MLVLAGVASLLVSYPPLSFYPLAWIAPVFLFACLVLTPLRKAFRYGYFFGFLFYLLSLYWISFVTGAGWIFAAFFQALYIGFFALGVRFLMEPVLVSGRLRYRILFLAGSAGLWVVFEWIRVNLPGFGFGWNLLAYSQAFFLPIVQTAEIAGAYGISFLMVLNAGFIFLLILDWVKKVSHRWLHAVFYVSIAAALFLSVFSFGFQKLKEPLQERPVRVGVVQGDIPQQLKWAPQIKEKIIEKYIKLTELLLYDRPDMVIWPEAAYPGYLLKEMKDSGIQKLIQKSKTPFLIGSPRYQGGSIYNSVLWFDGQSGLEEFYDKRNLVPFGEYIPFKKLFFFLEKIAYSFGVGDFSPGERLTVFEAPLDFSFSALVCFENIFPSLTNQLAKQGAEFFVVVTNDAWFKKSQAPYEHFYVSIFRAVETRRPFVHVANTGISGFINARGEITGTLKDKKGEELFISGGRTEPVYPQNQTTIYVKYGHLVPLAALGFTVLALGIVFLTRRINNQ